MFSISFDFDTIEWYIWVLAGIFLLSFVIQLFYYLYFYSGVLSLKKKVIKSDVPYLTNYPAISVIICARNESENLIENLPYILNQKYPNFEVIVVNDGSSDETETVLTGFEKQYPQLYHTYVPSDAQVMSPKKLALTVGIKAAKNDLLLFTDADCRPISEYWIKNMARNFTPNKDFVLGYGAYEQKKGLLSHLISFDTFFIALQYMGFAYREKPYMGVGRNMAYRKQVFFDMKGFASMLHLQSGDDDLFVNKAAQKTNTRIEINPDSVTTSSMKPSFKDWYIQKERHLSTSAYYKSGSKQIIGIEVLSRGFFYISLLGLILFAPLSIICGALTIFLGRYITQALIINLSAKHFRERRFYLSILIFDIMLPLVSLYILSDNKMKRKTKYKWK